MNACPRRATLAALTGLAAALVFTPPAPARGDPHDAHMSPFLADTHVFRRILLDLRFRPLADYAQLTDDPANTLLVVLGSTEPLQGIPGGLEPFLQAGGAVLVASDQPPSEAVQNLLKRVAGVAIERKSLSWVNAPVRNSLYRNLDDCPFLDPVEPVGPGLPSLLANPREGASLRVATNIPAVLEPSEPLPDGIGPLAQLPSCIAIERNNDGRIRRIVLDRLDHHPLFAVGGPAGERGRLLVLADHSVFINEMMLLRDTDNIEFAYNCLEWLRKSPGGKPRRQALVVQDGIVQKKFDLPLQQLPGMPPEHVIVQAIDQQVAAMEKKDVFNKVAVDLLTESDFLRHDPRRPVRWLLYLFTAGLVVYGGYRLGVRACYRPEAALPPLAQAVAEHTPDRPLVELRRRALLRGGNLWESAHTLARQCFAAAGVPADAPSRPRVHVRAGPWRRGSLARKVRRLWRLAHDPRPVAVSAARFRRLLGELDEVRAALADGSVRLEVE